jgi:3-isopropylmalate/(R)-2-methylmalate dehydratase large subunit
MTMTQKILAAHAGKDFVRAGEFIQARLDLVLGNDITAPPAIKEFCKLGQPAVFNKDKIALVPDHFTPNKDIQSAEQCRQMRVFAHDQSIKNYFEIGEMGIEHALIPEKGLVVPGDVVIGADSHTCTYGALGAFSTGIGSTDMAAGMATGLCWFRVPEAQKFVLKGALSEHVSGKDVILHIIGKIGVDGVRYQSMEFTGEGVANLTMDDRFTISNMAIEAGAKNGIFPVDFRTEAYLKNRGQRPSVIFEADPDAVYAFVHEIDLSAIRPTVSFPHSPDNTRTIEEIEHMTIEGSADVNDTKAGIRIDQVVIGSCTNGRLGDLRIAARYLKGRKVAKGMRLIIFPATQQIYLDALREGLIEIFIEAGGVVSTPTCGPCLGGHMGILAKGERAVATTNRNFVGRMGHVESEIYLASPAVAAATAIAGKIQNPETL